MIEWLINLWTLWRHPPQLWDEEFLSGDIDFGGLDCPDTQPTKPGALDGL